MYSINQQESNYHQNLTTKLTFHKQIYLSTIYFHILNKGNGAYKQKVGTELRKKQSRYRNDTFKRYIVNVLKMSYNNEDNKLIIFLFDID